MPLSRDVRQLSRHLLESYDSRLAAIAGIRAQTAQHLGEMQATRQSMADEQRRRLDEYRQQLADQVTRMQGEVKTWRDDVQAARQSAAAEQRRQLQAENTLMRQKTAALREEMAAAHRSTAVRQRQWLKDQTDLLHQETGAFLEAATAAHRSVTAEQHRALDEYTTGLRREIGALLGELRSGRHLSATYQRQWLGEQMEDLTAERIRMASVVAGMRSELQKDRSEATRVWSSFGKLKQQRRAHRPHLGAAAPDESHRVVREDIPASPTPAPTPTQEVELAPPHADTSPPSTPAPDDLTVIHGIGPGVQSRLNEKGIYSYAQLASSAPEDLHHLLGGVAGRANLEDWIQDARKLAS